MFSLSNGWYFRNCTYVCMTNNVQKRSKMYNISPTVQYNNLKTLRKNTTWVIVPTCVFSKMKTTGWWCVNFQPTEQFFFHLNYRFLLCEQIHNVNDIPEWVCVFVGDRKLVSGLVSVLIQCSSSLVWDQVQKKNIMQLESSVCCTPPGICFISRSDSGVMMNLYTKGADMSARWLLLENTVSMTSGFEWPSSGQTVNKDSCFYVLTMFRFL